MAVNVRITANVNLCLLFSTDLLVDYQANPPAPTQQHINDFLNDITQPGGPVAAAFNYLHAGGFLPAGVV